MEIVGTLIASNVVTCMIRSKWLLISLYDGSIAITAAWSFITASQRWAHNLNNHVHISNGRCWCDPDAFQFKLHRVRATLQDYMVYRQRLSPDATCSSAVVNNLDHLMNIFERLRKQICIVKERFEQAEKAWIWRSADVTDCMKQFDVLFPRLDYHLELFLQAWRDEKLFELTTFESSRNDIVGQAEFQANIDVSRLKTVIAEIQTSSNGLICSEHLSKKQDCKEMSRVPLLKLL